MRTSLLASALALAFAATGAQAVAIGDTPDLDLQMSGATAPDNFLDTIFAGPLGDGVGGMFKPGYIKYLDNVDGKLYRAYFGVINDDVATATGIAKNTTVRVVKRSAGGSVWGVNPVARATPIQTLGLSAADCATGTGTLADPYRCKVKGADEGTANYVAANLDGDTLDGDTDPDFNRVSDYGVSDVAPFMFKDPFNVEFGVSQLSNDEVDGLTITGTGLIAMSMVATDEIPDTTHLSRAAYGSMLTGTYRDWSQVDAALAGPNGLNPVVVCRRHNGSGTQTSYNWFFNNFPCTGSSLTSGVDGTTVPTRNTDSDAFALGVSAPLLDTDNNGIPNCQDNNSNGSCDVGEPVGTSTDPFIVDPTAGYTVVNNSGSGQVRDCLKNASSGTDYTTPAEDGTYFKYQFSKKGDLGLTGFGAIGVLSLDSLADKNDGWSFRKVDGAGSFDSVGVDTNADGDFKDSGETVTDVAGSGTGVSIGDDAGDNVDNGKSNLIAGNYDFAVEITMQHRDALAGNELKFVTEFIKRAGAPSFNKVPWVAALPPTYTPFDVDGEHVAKGTRFGNMCQPLQLLF